MNKMNLPIECSNFLDFIPEEFLEGIDEAKDVINGIPFAGSIISFGIRKYVQQREINFLIDVIEERRKISKAELDKKLFLKRAYLTSQVIAKTQTQEKYNRFKNLLLNSTLYNISDDTYELYNELVDEISDADFLILKNMIDWRDCVPERKHLSQLGIASSRIQFSQSRLEAMGLLNLEITPSKKTPSNIGINLSGKTNNNLTQYVEIKKTYNLSQLAKPFLNFIKKQVDVDD